MASQRRKAREEFFDRLDQLDDLSDSETQLDTSSGAKDALRPDSTRRSTRSKSVKPSLQKAASSPQVLTAPVPPVTLLPAASAPGRPTASLKRARSDAVPPSSKLKRNAKRKQETVVPAQALIFPPEMCFLFVPNRGLTSLQQSQIDEAEKHGARLAAEFSKNVTHIVVDSNWTLSQALEELPDKCHPTGITMVNWTWVVESLLYGLRDSDQHRFRVKGATGTTSLHQTSSTDKRPAPSTDHDLMVAEPKQRNVGQTTPQKNGRAASEADPELSRNETDKNAQTDDQDELDLLQKEMDKNDPAIEDLMEHDPSSKFEGNYVIEQSSNGNLEHGSFSCMNKNERNRSSSNPNQVTIRLLNQMAEIYDANTADQWRARAFKQAASALARQKELVATEEQAAKIRGIGASIAPKIEEIVTKGRLARLDEANNDPLHKTRVLFSRVYGVGGAQAAAWVAAGYTTLDDLKRYVGLTPNQRIGIEHFDDFETRIPRAEVVQHGLIVDHALKQTDQELKMYIGGSFRRGSPDSGDIDILITKEGAGMEQIQTVVMDTLIPQLKQQGFIVAELASGHWTDKETPSKWMGASVLPGQSIWRRLDILFVPWEELGAALIYWTGNDFFNRSLRLLASRKKMRLNQHGL
ncbi:DNA polymerase lambda [Cyphellophora attinorum]|uniref:DNA polymerase n=1 Tax=Cyphellophora attinorum TaxID=1664694 RepID=A0A0N1HZ36_9EURO|nr:DNA polymerase lambda [Phialophora attinorum]KPI43932.1 DNA polymerase lambda [Phialophora attinorum]